jgi:hypothetical protein
MFHRSAFTAVLLAVISVGCDREEGEHYHVDFDRGIQCSPEIRSSLSSITLLPPDIESQIASYLDLEFGAPEFSEPVSVEDIVYVGEFEACGKPIKFWEYPCGYEPGCYATIQPFEDTYVLGMTNTNPEER